MSVKTPLEFVCFIAKSWSPEFRKKNKINKYGPTFFPDCRVVQIFSGSKNRTKQGPWPLYLGCQRLIRQNCVKMQPWGVPSVQEKLLS